VDARSLSKIVGLDERTFAQLKHRGQLPFTGESYGFVYSLWDAWLLSLQLRFTSAHRIGPGDAAAIIKVASGELYARWREVIDGDLWIVLCETPPASVADTLLPWKRLGQRNYSVAVCRHDKLMAMLTADSKRFEHLYPISASDVLFDMIEKAKENGIDLPPPGLTAWRSADYE
jgi:hypothetical protein